MSTFTETITLENVADASAASRGYIPKTQIRSLTLEAMPDTGAWTLVINEDVRQKLGLAIEGSVNSTLADGTTEKYPQTEAVKIRWKNRSTTQQAVVLPHAKKVLLGALPLEAMDLQVDPVNECLAGVHGDEPLYTLM
jgi:clan AA aspartic protease